MLKTILKLEHERLSADALTDSIKLSELINRFDDSDYCKKYLSAEIKWMTYRHIIEQGMNLNEQHNKELAESIAESTVYNRFELNNLLKLMASTRINYLIRPNFTLEKFIFRNELTKPMDEILIRLDYFADNEYLLSGIKDVFENLRPSNPREIYTVSTFAKITENYDESFISELNTYEFAALLEPLGRLYFAHGFSGIPVNAISIFLSDKNLVQAAALFENNLQGVEYLLSPDMIIVELEKIIDLVNPSAVSAKPDDIFSVDDELEYISDDDLSVQIAGINAISKVADLIDEEINEEQDTEIDENDESALEEEAEKILETEINESLLESIEENLEPVDDSNFDSFSESDIENAGDLEIDYDDINEFEDDADDEDNSEIIQHSEISDIVKNIQKLLHNSNDDNANQNDPSGTKEALAKLFEKLESFKAEDHGDIHDEDIAGSYTDDILNKLSNENEKEQ